MNKYKNKGFTLVELLLVIAIIAILATVLFVSLGKQRERARKTAFKENMRGLVTTYSACKDGGGAPAGGAANGSITTCGGANPPAGMGNIPTILNCDGATNITITMTNPASDFWYYQADCTTNSGATHCWANCNSDGCIFCNTQLTPTNGVMPQCAASSGCE